MLDTDSISNYAAISYAWGEPVLDRTIYIGAHEVRITDSLFSALCRFRHPRHVTCLWADQLCISQEDLGEKNHQVAQMAKIFGMAREVYIWLGRPAEHHDIAFSMLNFLSANGGDVSTHYDRISNPERTLDYIRRKWQRHNPDVGLDDACAAFSKIAKKNWFERLWVVQEVMMSRQATFFCGQHRITYVNALEAFATFEPLVRIAGLVNLDANRETWVVKLYSTRNGIKTLRHDAATSFLELLIETSHLRVTEPRDRVFALASIANRDEPGSVRVDYGIALPALWRQVARFILEASESFTDSSHRVSVVLHSKGHSASQGTKRLLGRQILVL